MKTLDAATIHARLNAANLDAAVALVLAGYGPGKIAKTIGVPMVAYCRWFSAQVSMRFAERLGIAALPGLPSTAEEIAALDRDVEVLRAGGLMRQIRWRAKNGMPAVHPLPDETA